MRYLVLTGLSGAGKTSVARYLEDMGAFCVDNLPPMMMFKFIEACETSALRCKMVAIAVDVRGAEFFNARDVKRVIDEARQLGYHIETLFLEASEDDLVSRYKETRREHPLSGGRLSLTEALAQEREMIQPLREAADYLIDTSGMKTRQLQKKLQSILDEEGQTTAFRVEIMSFGFKRGLPRQADLVFDVRVLPNPFYIEELCRHTGLDEDVRDFVMNHPVTQAFMTRLQDMVTFLLPHYHEEGKRRLVIAIGCTGGAHRSVAIAEALGQYLSDQGLETSVNHRDIELEQAHWKTLEGG